MAINKDTTTQKLVSMPKKMAEAIADYRFKNRLRSEAEAIRNLVDLGLQASEASEKDKKNINNNSNIE